MSHNAVDKKYNYNDAAMFQRFIQEVNSQQAYNKNRVIDAIPIIAYHDIDDYVEYVRQTEDQILDYCCSLTKLTYAY